ncbi:MAG: DUF3106 domain-containing protein [Planctomycetota bacterium]|nr:DUF3106 domain-containing protein [Planctomycetota bacterium]
MRRLIVTTTAILLAALLTPPSLRAQGRKIDKRPPQPRTNSERWQRLDPAKRSEIERIYQQLRSLPAEKQKKLLDKLHRMQPEERRRAVRDARHKLTLAPHERELQKKHKDILRQSWNRLPPEEQKRLREMKPEAREKRLHARFMAERARIVARLPEDLRQRVLTMAAPQQADFLRKHKAKITSERIFKTEEIARLRSLDHKQLRRLFHPSHKNAPGPAQKPDFLSDSSWKKWNALRPYERPRVVGFLLGKDRRRPQNGSNGRRPPPSPGGRKPPPGGEGGRGRPEQMSREETLKRFDKNADGKLDEAERKAAREQFQQDRESRGNGAGQSEPRPEGLKPPRRPALRRSNGPPRTAPQEQGGQRPPRTGNARPPGQQPRPNRARPGARPAPGRKKR